MYCIGSGGIKLTNSLSVFICVLLCLFVLFSGEPDIHDAIIDRMMRYDCPVPLLTATEAIELINEQKE